MFLHGYDCHRPYIHGSVFHHTFEGDYQGDIHEMLEWRSETEKIIGGRYFQEFLPGAVPHVGSHPVEPIADGAFPAWSSI